jgi:hypothetical protein
VPGANIAIAWAAMLIASAAPTVAWRQIVPAEAGAPTWLPELVLGRRPR